MKFKFKLRLLRSTITNECLKNNMKNTFEEILNIENSKKCLKANDNKIIMRENCESLNYFICEKGMNIKIMKKKRF